MKNKIVRTFLPTILGIFTVLGLLFSFNLIFHNGDALTKPDNGFFKYFVPITTIFAMIIQFFLTLPFWDKFKSHNKVWGFTLFQFMTLNCIISGLAFGLVFWEPITGIHEFYFVSLTGLIAFIVYWTVNLLTLHRIDKTKDIGI